MAALRYMPARGHPTAPIFDPSQPRTLRRYFADLELLFGACQITDDLEKKRFAAHYFDFETSELVASQPEFIDASKSFEDLKVALRRLYPGAEDDRKYSLSDLAALIQQWQQRGISNLADLGSYYRDFLTITRFLISKNRLSQLQQNFEFIRAFSEVIWTPIAARLQVKSPDHHPDDPYPISEVFEAASWILRDTRLSRFNYSLEVPSPPSPIAPFPSPPATIAPSPLLQVPSFPEVASPEFLQVLGRSMASAFLVSSPKIQFDASKFHSRSPSFDSSCYTPQLRRCFFDGCSRTIATCLGVLEDISKGFVCRNANGWVTLPGGVAVPRNLPGSNMRERAREWHRSKFPKYAPTPYPSQLRSFELSTHERIKSIERELAALRRAAAFPVAAGSAPHRVPPSPPRMAPPLPRSFVPQPQSSPPLPQSQHTLLRTSDLTSESSCLPAPVPRRPCSPRPPILVPTPPPSIPCVEASKPLNPEPAVPSPVPRKLRTLRSYDTVFHHTSDSSEPRSCVLLTPAELLRLPSEIRARYYAAETPSSDTRTVPSFDIFVRAEAPSPVAFDILDSREDAEAQLLKTSKVIAPDISKISLPSSDESFETRNMHPPCALDLSEGENTLPASDLSQCSVEARAIRHSHYPIPSPSSESSSTICVAPRSISKIRFGVRGSATRAFEDFAFGLRKISRRCVCAFA